MKHWIRAILPLAAASASMPAMAADPTAPYPLTARHKADIVRQVKDHLADGESARWRWPLHQPEFGMYCGWVNAKNQFGSYMGWTPFMVIGGVEDGSTTTGEYKVIPPVFDREVVVKMCAQKGYDLRAPPPE